MNVSVEKTSTGKYGIWLEDDWLKTHFDPIPLETEEKFLIDKLAGEVNTAQNALEIIDGRVITPSLPLYHILSFYSQITNNQFDLISDDYDWIISCDPIFHPVSGPEQSAQLSYFEPVLEWLDEIGVKHKILPQRFQSKEELIAEGQLDEYMIREEYTDTIFEHWNVLSTLEKAAFYYIYLNAEHNFIASFLALKGWIQPDEFGKLVTASIGVAPEFMGVTETTFNEGWNHYSTIVKNALQVKKEII